eukprot:2218401-Pyramimonas_sp.AAC.1
MSSLSSSAIWALCPMRPRRLRACGPISGSGTATVALPAAGTDALSATPANSWPSGSTSEHH